MSTAVWIAFAQSLEQQVEKNKRVIEAHFVGRMKHGARPEDLYDQLIEDLRAVNGKLRELAAQARARIAAPTIAIRPAVPPAPSPCMSHAPADNDCGIAAAE